MSDLSKTVLLVEDDADDLFALKWALKKANANCSLVIADNGKEAKEYLLHEGRFSDQASSPAPKLILMDLKLPYVTGFEVLTWMRGQPALKNLEVVVLSGSDEPRDHARAKELGASGYLVKPATPEQLSDILKPRGLL